MCRSVCSGQYRPSPVQITQQIVAKARKLDLCYCYTQEDDRKSQRLPFLQQGVTSCAATKDSVAQAADQPTCVGHLLVQNYLRSDNFESTHQSQEFDECTCQDDSTYVVGKGKCQGGNAAASSGNHLTISIPTSFLHM